VGSWRDRGRWGRRGGAAVRLPAHAAGSGPRSSPAHASYVPSRHGGSWANRQCICLYDSMACSLLLQGDTR